MLILIGISIILPLIHNTIAKKRKHYKEPIDASKFIKTSNSYTRTENNHTVMKKDFFVDKVLTDNVNNRMSLKENFETKRRSFEIFNKTMSRCNNNNDINLDLYIDQDLDDVSSLSLTNYFEFNPDELEKILNDGIDQKNKENYTIKDMVGPKDLNEENINEKNKFNILVESVFYDMKQYIECNLAKYYQKFYLRRLETITNIIKLLEKKLEFEEQKFIFSSYDQKLEKVLFSIYKNFRKDRTFDQDTCCLLMEELKQHIYKIAKSHYNNWYYLSNKGKILKFVFEFMKLYRYVYNIPEILTLGGLVIGKLSVNSVFFLHLINVFIEKIGKPKENEVFIKCLMYNAFLYSSRHRLIFFSVPDFYIKCHNNHKNIQFFSWELHFQIRYRIKQGTIKNHNYEIDKVEIIHMKIVLLFFLYQHIIFLKCYCNNIGDIRKLYGFIKRVINSEECIVCIYDDFLQIMGNQTSKL